MMRKHAKYNMARTTLYMSKFDPFYHINLLYKILNCINLRTYMAILLEFYPFNIGVGAAGPAPTANIDISIYK